MLALLLFTAVMTSENPAPHSANKTITFSGIVPASTCQMDSYSDSKLAQLNQRIICPDNKYVTVKKEHIIFDNKKIEAWVIQYDKND
ncbi:UNVERIFIED_CONTAM: type 1 fimbrial protein [Aeromonas hydrophila]